MTAIQLGQLDFIYSPSRDVAQATKFVEEKLGGRVIFAIEGMSARVAMIELGEAPPFVVFADHLEGEGPILVYRVSSIEETLSGLDESGLAKVRNIEIPQGPCCSFQTPDGLRVAIYELTRPQVETQFHGRRDF